MIPYFHKDIKYEEWRSEINYCIDITYLSTKKSPTNNEGD
jgi:hypothetical protein